jgi:hemolysin activation/secretion protein
MDLWGAGFNMHHRDDMSSTSITFNYTEPMSVDNDDDILARTWDSDFSIFSTSANHSQYLDQNKVEQLRSTFRWIEPSERLPDVKMTSFGGMYSVRGYDEYEIVADGGILASIQYEYDLVRHSQTVEQKTATNEELKRLAPLVFFDYGRAKIENPVVLEESTQTLYSVGVGVAFEYGNNFSGALYYGYPLKDTDDTNRGKGRISASAMLRW